MAKVIKPFKGCRDDSPRVVQFKPGDEVTGDLERVGIEQGYAENPDKRADSAKSKVSDGQNGNPTGGGSQENENSSTEKGGRGGGKPKSESKSAGNQAKSGGKAKAAGKSNNK